MPYHVLVTFLFFITQSFTLEDCMAKAERPS